jgi:hypothetical protein
MQPVTQTKDLGENVMYFNGKTLDDVLQSATEFAHARGAEAQRYYVMFKDPLAGQSW